MALETVFSWTLNNEENERMVEESVYKHLIDGSPCAPTIALPIINKYSTLGEMYGYNMILQMRNRIYKRLETEHHFVDLQEKDQIMHHILRHLYTILQSSNKE